MICDDMCRSSAVSLVFDLRTQQCFLLNHGAVPVTVEVIFYRGKYVFMTLMFVILRSLPINTDARFGLCFHGHSGKMLT